MNRSVQQTTSLLVLDGNCQAQHLAAMLRAAKVGEVIYAGRDFGVMPAYAGKGCRIVAPRNIEAAARRARQEGRRVIQISQQTPLGLGEGIGALGAADKRILFPELRMWSLSRRKFTEWFRADFEPERIFELDLSSMEASERKAGFPVSLADFFRANVRRRPLFHTVAHPAGALFALLLRGIAVLLRDEIDPVAIEAVANDISGREGLNYLTHHPLAAADRTKLQFDWGDDYELYAAMIELRETAAWDRLREIDDRLLAAFLEDSQFWRTRMEMGRALNDDDMAIEAFEQLLSRCPGAVFRSYAQFLLAVKQMDRLDALVARAEAFYEGAFGFDAFVARVFLMRGDLARAETHARACHENNPDEPRAAFPLLQVLIRKRDGVAFRGVVDALRANESIVGGQLNAFLANQPARPWIEQVLGGIPADRGKPPLELPEDW